MKPTVGRIVHYHERGDCAPRAAIITNVMDSEGSVTLVRLTIFSDETAAVLTQCCELVAPGREHPDSPHARWPPRELDDMIAEDARPVTDSGGRFDGDEIEGT